MSVNVPEGMSCVNAFRALWENSKPAAFFRFHPELEKPQAETVSTAKKVAELFKERTNFDYQGGRLLKSNFKEFPKLYIFSYDKEYGPGSAKKALEEYNKIPSNKRFDKNDSYKFSELIQSN